MATGVAEAPPPPRPPSRAAAGDEELAWVDHAALAAEATALLSRVSSVRTEASRRRRSGGGGGAVDAVALDAVAATARSVLRLATSPELPSFCPATTLRCLADLDAEVDAVSGGGGSAERRASWVGVFDLSGDEGGATASDSDDGDRPPPHVLDLGAALDAAMARGGRRRR